MCAFAAFPQQCNGCLGQHILAPGLSSKHKPTKWHFQLPLSSHRLMGKTTPAGLRPLLCVGVLLSASLAVPEPPLSYKTHRRTIVKMCTRQNTNNTLQAHFEISQGKDTVRNSLFLTTESSTAARDLLCKRSTSSQYQRSSRCDSQAQMTSTQLPGTRTQAHSEGVLQ